jgi:hypothetical protein
LEAGRAVGTLQVDEASEVEVCVGGKEMLQRCMEVDRADGVDGADRVDRADRARGE